MNSDPCRVMLTGVGALSALGETSQDLWDGLLQGRSGIRCLQRFASVGLPASSGGEVESVAANRLDRDLIMARRALGEALNSAALLDSSQAGLIWSTGLDTFSQDGPGRLMRRSSGGCFWQLSRAFGWPRRMVASACASGTQAVGEAFRLIRSGRASRCAAGGSSVMLTPFYVIGFAGLQALATDLPGNDPCCACRPFDRRRRGFVLADGAAALVLESLSSALQRGAPLLAEVVGFGVSQDAFDLNRPPADGSGAELCMRRALEDASFRPADIDSVNAHGTGTLAGDAAEAAALRRVFRGSWRRLPVSSVKGAVGHAMAAAGALEAIVAARSCAAGLAPPTVNLEEPDEDCELDHVIGRPRSADIRTVLSVSFGMGGQNAAIILKRAP